MQVLTHLHAKKLIHRYLSPEKILFLDDERETLKLIGFRNCVILDNQSHIAENTPIISIYSSPEQISGKYNEKCDIWAVGVIVYIMLLG